MSFSDIAANAWQLNPLCPVYIQFFCLMFCHHQSYISTLQIVEIARTLHFRSNFYQHMFLDRDKPLWLIIFRIVGSIVDRTGWVEIGWYVIASCLFQIVVFWGNLKTTIYLSLLRSFTNLTFHFLEINSAYIFFSGGMYFSCTTSVSVTVFFLLLDRCLILTGPSWYNDKIKRKFYTINVIFVILDFFTLLIIFTTFEMPEFKDTGKSEFFANKLSS